MLKVLNGEITIHKGDAFSLMCMTDTEDVNAEDLNFYLVDEENNVILKKTAKNMKMAYILCLILMTLIYHLIYTITS